MADNIEIDGFVERRQELERLLMTNPEMEKKVQGLIRKVLLTVRNAVARAASSKMEADPRQAYRAVKTAVYRQILGGSVSILNKKRPGIQMSAYEPIKKLQPNQRGGNRKPRSDRSNDLLKYAGPDRGFVLRFLNAGTTTRGIKFHYDESRQTVHRGSRGGNLQKYGKTINTGNRGRIGARNFFPESSHTAMQSASEQLARLIDMMIKQELQ